MRIALAIAAAPLLISNLAPASFEERLLNAHNRERIALGLQPLVWDDALESDARSWAGYLARLGTLVHSDDEKDGSEPQGENLWAGTASYYGPEAMVRLWLAEKTNLRPGRIPDVSATGNFEDVGHYTQVVWRKSTHVGCAKVRGRADDFLVCRYSEGGNVIGEEPY